MTGFAGPAAASLIHGLDPRVRIIAAAAFAMVIVPGQNLTMLSAGLGFAMLLALLARLSPALTLKRLLAVDFFIVAMVLMLPFTLPGEPLFHLGELTASREGLRRAGEIALKANAVTLAVLTLIATIELAALGHALHHLRLPDKLTQLLLFTVRYIEVLQQEYQRLRLAMRARAFVPRSNRHTWRSFGYLFGMLLVHSLERSERILAAMKCRGFQGHYYVLSHFRATARDWLFATLFTGCLTGLIWLEWTA